jgi:hypothetical protein
MRSPRLVKSDYLLYLKCPQEFWLKNNQPLLYVDDSGDDLQAEHLRQQGYAVQQMVKQLERFRPTGERLVEFERVFQTAKYYARADLTVTDVRTRVTDIYEIKAAASVKEEHYDDVAFQRLAAESAGHSIGRCYVITMNGEYVRRGEIDVEQLFVITDVSDIVEDRMSRTAEQASAAIEYLKTLPVPSLIDYCNENKLDCRFLKLHFPGLPDYTVFDIPYLKHDKRRELLAQGIVDITAIPDDFELSKKQKNQVRAAKTGEVFIDRAEIERRICSWEYPLHFLDYETFQYAIPQFDGIKPFQQMCFQYSLHSKSSPDAPVEHRSFLSRGEGNPAREVAAHLKRDLEGKMGTVFVWYEPFEKGRNSEMAEMFPEYREFFEELNAKTCDLMKIFADNLYVHPDFKGRTSIKKVLPVICPHLSYQDLGIGDGMTASISWFRAATWRSMPAEERERIFHDLEEYCELDTLAMLEIFDHLETL